MVGGRAGKYGRIDDEVPERRKGAMCKAFELRLECQSKPGRTSYKLTLSVWCAHFLGVPGGRVQWFGEKTAEASEGEERWSDVGTTRCGHAMGALDGSGGSGPAWAEWALFFVSLEDDDDNCRSSLHDHHPSRLENTILDSKQPAIVLSYKHGKGHRWQRPLRSPRGNLEVDRAVR